MIRFYPVPLLQLKKFLRLAACLLLLISFSAQASDSLHMLPLSLQDRVKAAALVVEGEVIAQRSFWDENHYNIYTSNTIRVYKIFKGELQPQELEVITEGGTVGLNKHVFSAALQLHGGQQGIFFLDKEVQLRQTPAATGFTGRAYGGKQGFIRYDLQELSASDVFSTFKTVDDVYNAVKASTGKSFRELTANLPLQHRLSPPAPSQFNAMAPVISGFSPITASAGTGTVLTINGSGFGDSRGNSSVKFRNGDDGGKTTVEPHASAYKLWTDTRIQVEIPSYGTNGSPAGTGPIQVTTSDGSTANSSSNINIYFVYSNVLEEGGNTPAPPILIDKNELGGYTISFGPNMSSHLQARQSFRRAMNSWICNTQVNWRIGSPTDITKAAQDKVNAVIFTSISANTLAQTISRYSGCRNLTTRDITWWLDEFDMEISQNTNWNYSTGPLTGNQFDFETVVLHELGHAHQLGHVIQPRTSAMHFSVEARAQFRTLNPADIEGGSHVMDTSFEPARLALAALCDAKKTSRNTDGECNLADEILLVEAKYITSESVLVTWTTSNEQNITGFTIRRSPDGITWTTIGTQSPTGPGTYSFTDTDPLPGTSYYHVSVSYGNSSDARFSLRERAISPNSINTFSLFPNPTSPTNEVVQLEYIVEQDTPLTLRLYDFTGKLVLEKVHIFTDANLPYTLHLHHLSAGIYILVWSNGNERGEQRLVKL